MDTVSKLPGTINCRNVFFLNSRDLVVHGTDTLSGSSFYSQPSFPSGNSIPLNHSEYSVNDFLLLVHTW